MQIGAKGRNMSNRPAIKRASRRSGAADDLVRRSAGQIHRASAADLGRLRRQMQNPIDSSDIPRGGVGAARVVRRQGRLPAPRRSKLREAMLIELGRRDMTRYQLWQRARRNCPTLPESAVY